MKDFRLPNRRAVLAALAAFSLLPLARLGRAAETDDRGAFAQGEMALGSEDAPVTVIEYFSLTCSHCRDFHRNTFGDLRAAYIDTGKVRFVVREFPGNDLALRAAMLARCSGGERYFSFIQMLYDQFDYWVEAPDPMAALAQIAALGGIPRDAFDACVKDSKVEDAVLQSYLSGVNDYKVEYTPTFIVNGRKFVGDMSLDKFRLILDPLLGGG